MITYLKKIPKKILKICINQILYQELQNFKKSWEDKLLITWNLLRKIIKKVLMIQQKFLLTKANELSVI